MIKYPLDLKKKKVRINAYGNKAWGEVCYRKELNNGSFQEIGSMDYVRGYRDAIKETKKLNKR